MAAPTIIPPLATRTATRVLDMLFPPGCLKCGETVEQNGALCAACWSAITFIAPPFCRSCGLPFDHDPGPDALCGPCSAAVPAFDRARAVFVYDDDSRGLVLAFKHADRLHAAPTFAQWLARAGDGLIVDADVITPVPLHRWRLLRRRYNQSAVLAHYLARRKPGAVRPDLLIRHRATPPQGHRNASDRGRNVRNAFSVRPRSRIEGRRVLLIDDVYTTGATVSECARTLIRAGVKAVDVLTLARVVRASEPF